MDGDDLGGYDQGTLRGLMLVVKSNSCKIEQTVIS